MPTEREKTVVVPPIATSTTRPISNNNNSSNSGGISTINGNNSSNNNKSSTSNRYLNAKGWNKNGFGERIDPYLGKYSARESKMIKEAIEDYCKSHNIPTDRLCSDVDSRSEDSRGAWLEVAKVLPNRTVQSIYRHGLRIMHPFKRGLWSKEEIEELENLVAKHGKRWAYIQSELRRSSEACRDKYRELGLGFRRGRWLSEESKRLEKHVRELAKVDDNVHMADILKMVEAKEVSISWYDISKMMGNRSRLACYKRFQKLSGAKKNKPQRKDNDNSEELSSSSTNSSLVVATRNSGKLTNIQSSARVTDKDSSAKANNNPMAAATVVVPTTTSSSITSISISTPNPIRSNISTAYTNTSAMSDEDLINFIASSSFVKSEDVKWESDEEENRWEMLVETYMENLDGDQVDEILSRPLWEIAKIMLPVIDEDQKQAEMAARTVEAVLRI